MTHVAVISRAVFHEDCRDNVHNVSYACQVKLIVFYSIIRFIELSCKQVDVAFISLTLFIH